MATTKAVLADLDRCPNKGRRIRPPKKLDRGHGCCVSRSATSSSWPRPSSSSSRRRRCRAVRSRPSSSLSVPSVVAAAAAVWVLASALTATTTTKTTKTMTTAAAFGIPDPVVHFGIGAVAGGVGAFVAFPFEYVKTQMQTEYGKARWKNGYHAFVDILTSDPNDDEGGPLRLYKGLGVQLIGIAPEKGIKHGVNDVLASTFVTTMGTFPLWGQILSGAAAGACQVVVSSPLEVMKVGLQTSDMTIDKVWDQVGGTRGMYRGAQACIVRDVLWTAICFPLYTMWVHQSVPTFIAGATSGVIASFLATPADVVKTRILSQDKWTQERRNAIAVASSSLQQPHDYPPVQSVTINSNSTLLIIEQPFAVADDEQQFILINSDSSPWAVLCNIIEREGVGVLFSGVTERCVGGIPRFGTTMAMHDFLEHSVSHAGWLTHSLLQ